MISVKGQSVGKLCRSEFSMISIISSSSSRLFSKGIWHTSGNSCLLLPPSSTHRNILFSCGIQKFKKRLDVQVYGNNQQQAKSFTESVKMIIWYNFYCNLKPLESVRTSQWRSFPPDGCWRQPLFRLQHTSRISHKSSIQSPFVVHWAQHSGVSVGNWEQLSTHTDYKSEDTETHLDTEMTAALNFGFTETWNTMKAQNSSESLREVTFTNLKLKFYCNKKCIK